MFQISTHGRLQDWIAVENGYFEDEGLDYELDVRAQQNADQDIEPTGQEDVKHRRLRALPRRGWRQEGHELRLSLGGQPGGRRPGGTDVGPLLLGAAQRHLRPAGL